MSKLDRNRPYGSIHGSGGRACYEQDYKEFDQNGDEIVAAGTVIPDGKVDDGTVPQPALVLVSKDARGNLMKDRVILDLDGMELNALHALAKDMGLKLHPLTRETKAIAAITDAAMPLDQVAAQLGD